MSLAPWRLQVINIKDLHNRHQTQYQSLLPSGIVGLTSYIELQTGYPTWDPSGFGSMHPTGYQTRNAVRSAHRQHIKLFPCLVDVGEQREQRVALSARERSKSRPEIKSCSYGRGVRTGYGNSRCTAQGGCRKGCRKPAGSNPEQTPYL